jgi:hypothetical protein
MQYALLIYEDEAVYGSDDGKVTQEIIGKHMAFGQSNGGAIRAARACGIRMPPRQVRTQQGQQTLHDGPFAETREQLGGFYLVEADDLDAAIAIARKIPLAGDGSVEVRPLLPMPDGPPAA